MLFTDPVFIFIFLPICFITYHFLQNSHVASVSIGLAILIIASLVFYAYWKFEYVIILIFSILFNYAWARWVLSRCDERRRRLALAFGVVVNLSVLGFFKYTNFIAENAGALTGVELSLSIALPIGISFYTFQQISYLVDVYRDRVAYRAFFPYAAFIAFFPHLIAGPIVRHKEIVPQLIRRRAVLRTDIALGITLFTMGLVKKIAFADTFATFATPPFTYARDVPDTSLPMWIAWGAALAYSLQLYFDFSGYSDMARGLARFFGMRFPINFNSPYASRSIIEFWRRWHITLSRFLRDYLYITLGGNRRGPIQRHRNLIVTMLLAGFWHGAGWTFVIWGGLHGLLLSLNHVYRDHFATRFPWPQARWGQILAWLLTFIILLHTWVVFRAESPAAAWSILTSMWGQGAASVAGEVKAPTAPLLQIGGALPQYDLAEYMRFFAIFGAAGLFIATRQLNSNHLSVLWVRRLNFGSFRVRLLWAAAMVAGFYLCMMLGTYSSSAFLYFQF